MRDVELQTFARDVAKNGLGWEDENERGMPSEITHLHQLVIDSLLAVSRLCTESDQLIGNNITDPIAEWIECSLLGPYRCL